MVLVSYTITMSKKTHGTGQDCIETRKLKEQITSAKTVQQSSCRFSSNSHNRLEELPQVAGLGRPKLLLQWVARNFVEGKPAQIIGKIISCSDAVVMPGKQKAKRYQVSSYVPQQVKGASDRNETFIYLFIIGTRCPRTKSQLNPEVHQDATFSNPRTLGCVIGQGVHIKRYQVERQKIPITERFLWTNNRLYFFLE